MFQVSVPIDSTYAIQSTVGSSKQRLKKLPKHLSDASTIHEITSNRVNELPKQPPIANQRRSLSFPLFFFDERQTIILPTKFSGGSGSREDISRLN